MHLGAVGLPVADVYRDSGSVCKLHVPEGLVAEDLEGAVVGTEGVLRRQRVVWRTSVAVCRSWWWALFTLPEERMFFPLTKTRECEHERS